MAYRLPTHLESFIPPPAQQAGSHSRPWSGTFTLTFSSTTQGVMQDVHMTAAETAGDNQMHVWPKRFYVYLSQRRTPHAEVSQWVTHAAPPPRVCTFMPDRLPDPTANAANQESFAAFSRLLLENQLVAFAPWNVQGMQGAGIMIYPTPTSNSLLVGVVFLTGAFPEYVTYAARGGAHDVTPHQYQAPGTSSPYGTSGPAQSQRQYGYGY